MNGKTYYALEAMMQVKEDGYKEYRKIRVIIVEDKKERKIFFSVMESVYKREELDNLRTYFMHYSFNIIL